MRKCGMPRYKKYPFYVVMKNSGLVMAGAEYREDAQDMRKDLGVPAQDMQVLTEAGVMRKFGKVQWFSGNR